MHLHVKPNDKTGLWEIHDDSGFLCELESESTAALLVHSTNVLPELVAALEMARPTVEYYHAREGCPITLKTVRSAIKSGINPRANRRTNRKEKHHGRNS
jgi:hypothetical protein